MSAILLKDVSELKFLLLIKLNGKDILGKKIVLNLNDVYVFDFVIFFTVVFFLMLLDFLCEMFSFRIVAFPGFFFSHKIPLNVLLINTKQFNNLIIGCSNKSKHVIVCLHFIAILMYWCYKIDKYILDAGRNIF